jgi:lipopolysaccharide/colanic/teichoic acid biosynthesis glycosyltransferase
LKRLFDLFASFFGLLVLSPIIIPVCFLVWIQDWHFPFYVANRVGRNETLFKMVKLRSMVVNADKTGVDSTGNNDNRITGVGRFIRKCKLDEISQLWNVLIGDMSLVGPRPNVKRETDLYSSEEKKLLTVKPGITDFSSIVFSDEGDILEGKEDPDLAYNQLIRPWKSKLGLFYIENRTFMLDIELIFITIIAILSREKALRALNKILLKKDADDELIQVSKRESKLIPATPPGLESIILSR